jgi:hypothetical protein
MQVKLRPLGLRQRPVRGRPPPSTMVEPTRGVASLRSAAHHEDPHSRLRLGAVGDTLEPAVEPAPAQYEEILGEIAVDWSRRPEIDISGVGQRPVAMGPRAEDQANRAAL